MSIQNRHRFDWIDYAPAEKSDFVKEAGMLLKNRFGTVILDEAHKARARGGLGDKASEPNNLLAFMQQLEGVPSI